MCGDLWISEDGQQIFTKCGNVFRSNDSQAFDMTFIGAMAGSSGIVHMTDSVSAAKAVVIPGVDTVLKWYGTEILDFKTETALPVLTVEAESYLSHGKFVFIDSNGTSAFAIIQADDASGVKNHLVVTYNVTP